MNKLKKTTAKHLSFLQMMDKLSALLFTENYHLSDEAYRGKYDWRSSDKELRNFGYQLD